MKKILYIEDINNRFPEDFKCLCDHFDVVNYPATKEDEFLNIDATIQNCHYSNWTRYGTMRHIGYLDIIPDDPYKPFTMVDEIWASNMAIFDFAQREFAGKVEYRPHIVNLDIYQNDHKFQEIPEILGTFRFLYTSYDDKESVKNIIRSFWSEFDPTEPVSLIINSNLLSREEIDAIKGDMSLYDKNVYQKFILINSKPTLEQDIALHQLANCYINHNKNWDNGLIHSMGFNKVIISEQNSIVNNYDKVAIINNLNQNEVMKEMRHIYENIGTVNYGIFGIEETNVLKEFSKENFLSHIKELL